MGIRPSPSFVYCQMRFLILGRSVGKALEPEVRINDGTTAMYKVVKPGCYRNAPLRAGRETSGKLQEEQNDRWQKRIK